MDTVIKHILTHLYKDDTHPRPGAGGGDAVEEGERGTWWKREGEDAGPWWRR